MAGIQSLGLHTPSALHHLIAEAILPHEPKPSQYNWEEYQDPGSKEKEELLWTKDCVVFSRSDFAQRIFRYAPTDGPVTFALITHFSDAHSFSDSGRHGQTVNGHTALGQSHDAHIFGRSTRSRHENIPGPRPESGPRRLSSTAPTGRALVIFVGEQCHIHFIAGTTHVVNVPFRVASVFPTYNGLLLQRSTGVSAPASADPLRTNELATKPLLLAQLPHQVNRPSPLNADRLGSRLSFLDSPSKRFSTASMPPGFELDDAPHIFALPDPLADFMPVASATMSPLPRHQRSDGSDFIVEYDDLDILEKLIYVSRSDESATGPSAGNVAAPLLLFVTFNHSLGQLTFWQGWHTRAKALSTVIAARNVLKAARARRRSSMHSFLNEARTPVVRFNDKSRESFAAAARLPKDDTTKPTGKMNDATPKTTRDNIQQRIDPVLDLTQRVTRSSRKPGSSFSRSDAPTLDQVRLAAGPAPSHATALKQGQSLRMSQDRRSLGTSIYRKSRGSLAASAFSKSIGPEDGDSLILDGDSWIMDEAEAETARAHDLYQATNEFAGLDSAVVGPAEGIRPGLVLRKVHATFMSHIQDAKATSTANPSGNPKVRVLLKPTSSDTTAPELSVWIANGTLGSALQVTLRIITPSNSLVQASSRQEHPPVLIYKEQKIMREVKDIAKLHDDDLPAMLWTSENASVGVCTSGATQYVLPLPKNLQIYDPTDVTNELDLSSRDYGIKRTILTTDLVLGLRESATSSQVLAFDGARAHHVLHIRLKPCVKHVEDLLDLLQAALPARSAVAIPRIWRSAMHSLLQDRASKHSTSLVELKALCMAILSFAIGSLGPSRAATPRKSRAARSKSDNEFQHPLGGRQISTRSNGSAWAILKAETGPITRKRLSFRRSSSGIQSKTAAPKYECSFTDIEAATRALLHQLAAEDLRWLLDAESISNRVADSFVILLATNAFWQELCLGSDSAASSAELRILLAACQAQLGHYLQIPDWEWSDGCRLAAFYEFADMDFSLSLIADTSSVSKFQVRPPSSVYDILDQIRSTNNTQALLAPLQAACSINGVTNTSTLEPVMARTLPNLVLLTTTLHQTRSAGNDWRKVLTGMQELGRLEKFISRLPESVVAPLQEMVTQARRDPASSWSAALLQSIDRDDLVSGKANETLSTTPGSMQLSTPTTALDTSAVLAATERQNPITKSHEADRHAVIIQIFSEDRRFVDAARLLNPALLQVAECNPLPEWSDIEHLEQQKKVMQWVMVRTTALPAGNAMVHFESQRSLLSEKFLIPGFSTLCQMMPMNNTVGADRTGFTEEKLSWAFFHAGTSAGLHISRKAEGIDTSWIVFNKPQELTNRHAGFLLALGLNGHLRNMAKWLAFKYLTPKHTMTSIGLLLGLSASYIGTMDSLITRMLSVHITRMLPPGAAELNVSPLTQTAGLIGLGLLYCKTQHRRMSEMLLSELEYRDIEEAGSTADALRDESYMLAAGLSLGLINLGKGRDAQGLHGMALLERLLAIAVGQRPVELVHIIDKATAGSVMALALAYMKTDDASIAGKIDIPDTASQLDHVRPDILLLRAMAKNVIMWDSISDSPGWIQDQLPTYLRGHSIKAGPVSIPKSSDIPMYNIIAGHAWALALRFAGSGSSSARDEILAYLDAFWTASQQAASYYDAQLARTTLRRCIDILALGAATVMAGTGDLITFRYLRRLHGRTDAETTYGSHMSAHLAIGALFLGGGTYTFSTSDLAVASLMIAFYPLFPSEVQDNAVHLQALRHLWVLAAEPRCVVVVDMDNGRPISTMLRVCLTDGQERMLKAPGLLPELDAIKSIETVDVTYWKNKLDFENNPEHVANFRETQTLRVRKAPSTEAGSLIFSQTMTGLSDSQNCPPWLQTWASLLRLASFSSIDFDELGLAIPANPNSVTHGDHRGTVLDDRLAVLSDARSSDALKLSNVRSLLQWAADRRVNGEEPSRWLGDDFLEHLASAIRARMQGEDMEV